MNHLTKLYKNRCESLMEEIERLENLLEVVQSDEEIRQAQQEQRKKQEEEEEEQKKQTVANQVSPKPQSPTPLIDKITNPALWLGVGAAYKLSTPRIGIDAQAEAKPPQVIPAGTQYETGRKGVETSVSRTGKTIQISDVPEVLTSAEPTVKPATKFSPRPMSGSISGALNKVMRSMTGNRFGLPVDLIKGAIPNETVRAGIQNIIGPGTGIGASERAADALINAHLKAEEKNAEVVVDYLKKLKDAKDLAAMTKNPNDIADFLDLQSQASSLKGYDPTTAGGIGAVNKELAKGKILGKSVKLGLKALPIIGGGLGLYFGAKRAFAGDYPGAALELAGAVDPSPMADVGTEMYDEAQAQIAAAGGIPEAKPVVTQQTARKFGLQGRTEISPGELEKPETKTGMGVVKPASDTEEARRAFEREVMGQQAEYQVGGENYSASQVSAKLAKIRQDQEAAEIEKKKKEEEEMQQLQAQAVAGAW